MIYPLILAAGKGTRMRSLKPKVLQPLASRPLLAYVIDVAKQMNPTELGIVVGFAAEQVISEFQSDTAIRWVLQEEQKGTGHAVMVGVNNLSLAEDDVVLILYGDVPLIQQTTLADLTSLVNDSNPLALLTLQVENPFGYGRIKRDVHHRVTAIVEQKDLAMGEADITEVNSGIMAVRFAQLRQWLGRITNENAQNEYYLTDIVALAVEDGYPIATTHPQSAIEVEGVNDRIQLANLERKWQFMQATSLLSQGATVIDPQRLDIRGEVILGQDVVIGANVVFEGKVVLQSHVQIDDMVYLKDVHLGEGTHVKAFSHLEGVVVGKDVDIGPYARIRPGSQLYDGCRVGNFVEVKKSIIGKDSKVSHLSYIGDTQMGEEVNIGAGTITCNYDGVNKHQTIIGNRVFVGSDSQLIAPVTIEDDATIGAGTTLVKLAPQGELTLSRAKQVTIPGWKKPIKKL